MVAQKPTGANRFRLAAALDQAYRVLNQTMEYLMPFRLLVSLLLIFLFAVPAKADDLDTMIGQMIMAGFRGYTVDAHSSIMKDIRERHLGGVILFDYDVEQGKRERNIKSPDQVLKLTTDLAAGAEIPLLIAVDQEGGRVQRLKSDQGFYESPSAKVLGTLPNGVVYSEARSVGKALLDVGFNLNFAPVADVDVNMESPAIGKIERSFSADPARVAECDRIFLDGMASQGIIGCLKHFPGHGSAGGDSHFGVTDVTDTWSEKELIPYKFLIQNGSAEVIMTAHIFNAKLDADYPATLSHKVITGLLRDKLGFGGVVITDDMNMKAITSQYGQEEAIRLAIEAGADILLFGNNLTYDPDVVKKAHATIRRLVDEGVIKRTRINTSYSRIMRLKEML